MSATIASAPVAMPVEAKKPIKKVSKAPKAAGTKKVKPSHPTWAAMLTKSVKELHERGGSSIPAIKKHLMANYKVDSDKANPFIRRGLKSAITTGSLVQVKGKGLTGSFKLGATKAKPVKKVAGAKKSKKIAKPAGEKKLKTKKPSSPKKASPAKAKKSKKVAVAGAKTVANAAKPKTASPTKKVAKKPAAPKTIKKVVSANPKAAKKSASPKKTGVKSKTAKAMKAPKVPKPKSTKKAAPKSAAPKKQ